MSRMPSGASALSIALTTYWVAATIADMTADDNVRISRAASVALTSQCHGRRGTPNVKARDAA